MRSTACSTAASYMCQSSAQRFGRWIIEGHGVDPDIVVEQDPVEVLNGHDPRLQRGIQELMQCSPDIAGGLPRRAAVPVKTGLP